MTPGSLAQFRDRTRPDNDRAYVFRVAANIATDWHRRRSRELTGAADASARPQPTRPTRWRSPW